LPVPSAVIQTNFAVCGSLLNVLESSREGEMDMSPELRQQIFD